MIGSKGREMGDYWGITEMGLRSMGQVKRVALKADSRLLRSDSGRFSERGEGGAGGRDELACGGV